MNRMPLTSLYHVLPLHYVPHLIITGELLAQRELKERGLPIRPRFTVAHRDRKLRLDRFVHLSPRPITPLLTDKLVKGYPHCLVTFSTDVLHLPNTGLVKYNPKSWRHREDFEPVVSDEAMTSVWEEWNQGKYPSLEVVVPNRLPLVPYVLGMAFTQLWQREWLLGFCGQLALPLPLPITDWQADWPVGVTCDPEPYRRYLSDCLRAGQLLPPPDIVFD